MSNNTNATSNVNNNTNTTPTTDALFQIFTDSNIVIILWFLAVYFIVYLVLNIVRGRDGAKSSIARGIDIVALVFLLIYLGFSFFDKSDSEKSEMIHDMYLQFKLYLNTPLSLISVGVFIMVLYVVIYILAIPMDSFGKPITISIIENCAWIFFIIILFSVFLRYIAGISLTDFFDNIGKYFKDKADQATATTVPSADSSGNLMASLSSAVMSKYNGVSRLNVNINKTLSGNAAVSDGNTVLDNSNEVFNIGNDMLTYDDAQTVCASYGARLATYDEVETTYNNGGEWCNYGWSDGQAAYFPTQKNTWEKLQKKESTKHSCGRPGVNGGYIANPNVRFGANCFGKKPNPSGSDLAALSSGKIVPKTPEELLLEQKIEFWKNNREKLLQINSYNNNKWSMY